MERLASQGHQACGCPGTPPTSCTQPFGWHSTHQILDAPKLKLRKLELAVDLAHKIQEKRIWRAGRDGGLGRLHAEGVGQRH